VTIWGQLTGRAEKNQIGISPERPYGLTVNIGGDDKTLVAIVYRRGA
jgi:acetyl-CoA C-acetyltransferase/acetyl-CoA acyltransferase